MIARRRLLALIPGAFVAFVPRAAAQPAPRKKRVEDYPCDTCGKPSKHACRDAYETTSPTDKVQTWYPMEPAHFGCDEHAPVSRCFEVVYDGDGRAIRYELETA